MAVVPAETPQAPSQAPVGNRIDFLDSLRALAALYVMFSHMSGEVWWIQNHHQAAGVFAALIQLFSFGHFAVSTFIIVSGFCLMLPVLRKDGELTGGFMGFMKRRARRILPPYYLALLISLALALTLLSATTATVWDIALPVSVDAVYSHVVLLQDLVLPTQISYPLWSIAIEWRIYFLFPLLVVISRRIGPLWTTLVVSMMSYTVYVVFKYSGLVPAVGTNAIVPQYIALFTLGMLGATIAFGANTRWQRLRARVPSKLVAACAFAAFACVNSGFRAPDYGVLDGLLGIGMVAVMVAAAHEGSNALRSVLNWKPLVFVGVMSYSLYLLHAPLLQLIWQYGVRPLHLSDDATFLCLVVIGTPLVIGASYVFHLVAERPFMTAASKPAASKRSFDVRFRWTAS